MRGKIEVKGRWDYVHNAPRKKYDKKYYYWFLECTDENTGDIITCAPTYTELGKVLRDIIEHEINYYLKTQGIDEAIKRREQLSEAMFIPIKSKIYKVGENVSKTKSKSPNEKEGLEAN